MKRSSGILMPVFSLPGPYGIGTFGKAAYEFVDFLKAAGQSWWQILPVGPTSYGDSPYQSFSTFAGNPYFVDLDMLCEEGYLRREEIPADVWGADESAVDYGAIYEHRFAVLDIAAKRAWQTDEQQLERFWRENGSWLPDYALFMAVKAHFGMQPWYEWPDEEIRLRTQSALEQYGTLLNPVIRTHIFIQYQFYKQWDALRAYAHGSGVKIIGDLPIYVAMDSADVWANPACFQLDARRRPTAVAGVPPDAFSEEGQLWGNPLYNWDHMAKDGYAWWMERISGAVRLYDALRIDHFRGFESYWAVPADAPTAITGSWEKGPGMDFVGRLTARFPDTEFLAEDLGILTDSVRELLRDSKLPGMKVLEFAFSPDTLSDYLMHGHIPNSVCYCGTHDNTTLLAWRDEMSKEEYDFLCEYLALDDRTPFNWALLRCGMRSVSQLFVAQLQDYLGLGAEGRINLPGTQQGNWQWRLRRGQLDAALAEKIARMVYIYGREAEHEDTEPAAAEDIQMLCV